MERLADTIAPLSNRHRTALGWFVEHAGHDEPWPAPLDDGTLLASRAKGIYKPAWSPYALSVRQTLDGPYPDREPIVRTDGTWSYPYFQEGEDPAARDVAYTNKGLVECWHDKVPVGVLRQVSREPTLYRVFGVALVACWESGYFVLDGFSPDGWAHAPRPGVVVEGLAAVEEAAAVAAGAFQPGNLSDARERILASVVRRRGQPEFRQRLLRAYGSTCAISGCNAVEALEAAHIIPYLGLETNHLANGILLRADLHTLFDLGLLAVDTSTMSVIVAPELAGTSYAQLAGSALNVPSSDDLRPSKEALDQHRAGSRVDADG